MDEAVALPYDSSINRLRESRSIRPYPLGVYNFSKLEAEIEEAFGFDVTKDGVMWANQVRSQNPGTSFRTINIAKLKLFSHRHYQ